MSDPGDSPSPGLRSAALEPKHAHGRRRLGDYANTDNGYAWPSVANLARRSGLSTRQVQRCLRQIERDGWIERQPDTHRLGTTLWIWRKRIGLGVTPTSPPR
jgi:DNA-binding MarR family transcriptional regulator